MKQKIVKRNDDTVWYITEYNNQGQQTKLIDYKPDGKTIKEITNFDPQTSEETQKIIYQTDGTTVKKITNFDSQTSTETKVIFYYPDSTIKAIAKYDPQTGKPIKFISYNDDGETIEFISTCASESHSRKFKTTYYNNMDIVSSVSVDDKTKYIFYNSDNKTIFSLYENDNSRQPTPEEKLKYENPQFLSKHHLLKTKYENPELITYYEKLAQKYTIKTKEKKPQK